MSACSALPGRRCRANACEGLLRRCCEPPPPVFLAAAVSQLWASLWYWEAGEGCLVTKYLACSLFSRFWPSLIALLRGQQRWIGAARLSTWKWERKKGVDVFKYVSCFQLFSIFHGLFSSLQLFSNGVLEVNVRFALRFYTNQIVFLTCAVWRLQKKNGAKWIAVNAEQEKIFTLTSVAPAKMVPESVGHRGSVNSSSHKHSCSQSHHFHHLLLSLCSVSRSGQTGGNPEMLSK